MWSSTFSRFEDQKQKYDVILCHNMRMMHFTTGGYHISNRRIFHYSVVHKILSYSLFDHKSEIHMLIHAIITNISTQKNINMFFHLWKDWHKNCQYRYACKALCKGFLAKTQQLHIQTFEYISRKSWTLYSDRQSVFTYSSNVHVVHYWMIDPSTWATASIPP